jgi:hypothetical protein
MKLFSTLALAALVSASAAAQETTPLFNGKDLTGWKIPVGDNDHWKVLDGVIDYDAESEAKGDKSLYTEREFGDFELQVEWRIKATPFINPNVPYILPDGSEARDVTGKPLKLSLPDSDSGIILRGDVKNQVNIWCWPAGSGEFYGYRRDAKLSPEVRAAGNAADAGRQTQWANGTNFALRCAATA